MNIHADVHAIRRSALFIEACKALLSQCSIIERLRLSDFLRLCFTVDIFKEARFGIGFGLSFFGSYKGIDGLTDMLCCTGG